MTDNTESRSQGLVPDPRAHATELAAMIRKASEGYEAGTVRAHREQWAVVVAALEEYARSEIEQRNAAPQEDRAVTPGGAKNTADTQPRPAVAAPSCDDKEE